MTARMHELVDLPAVLDRAAAGRQHVAYPLRVGSVGQRDDASTLGPEDVHRRAVRGTGDPSDVQDNAETRETTGTATRDPVRHPAIRARSQCGSGMFDESLRTVGRPAARGALDVGRERVGQLLDRGGQLLHPHVVGAELVGDDECDADRRQHHQAMPADARYGSWWLSDGSRLSFR